MNWNTLNPFSSDFITGGFNRTSQYGTVDPQNDLSAQSRAAGFFANRTQQGFEGLGGEADALRAQIANRPSLSQEVLRQGLQQGQAQQMSMAAGARPGQAPMAARSAMMNAGRMSSGMSGQAATARIQEQQARDQAIAQMLMQQRQQELQAALGARGQALQGQGMLEQARTGRYAADKGSPTATESFMNSLGGIIPG